MTRVEFYRKVLPALILLAIASHAFAQKKDSTLFFGSSLAVTQNGFSFIPSFSLGKPAAILDMGVGNQRMSFEPQFRYALEGRPWSFIFIYRYKVIMKDRFQLKLGAHVPAFNFYKETVTMNGVDQNVITTKRFLAAEMWPTYKINDHVSMGLYLLRGHGFDTGVTRNAYFAGLQTYFTKLKPFEQLVVTFVPQFFYLKTDDNDGVYVTYTVNLAIENFPVSISHIINKSIVTEIPNTDFSWNVSLVYSFHKNYNLK